jgi:hypothetical protein
MKIVRIIIIIIRPYERIALQLEPSRKALLVTAQRWTWRVARGAWRVAWGEWVREVHLISNGIESTTRKNAR